MSKFSGRLSLTKGNDILFNKFVIKGIKDNNKFTYKENDKIVTIIIGDNKIDMKRVCSDYIINLKFDKYDVASGSYYLKEYKRTLPLEIRTNYLEISEKYIKIEYDLLGLEDEQSFVFSLEFEV